MSTRPLAVVGPTGTGKSALALAVAMLVMVASLSRSSSRASRAQASRRFGCGVVTLLMPSSETPRRMNGATEVGRSMPCASPQAATAPSALVMASTLASVVDPTASIPAAQRSLPSGLPGFDSSARSRISAAPSPFR